MSCVQLYVFSPAVDIHPAASEGLLVPEHFVDEGNESYTSHIKAARCSHHAHRQTIDIDSKPFCLGSLPALTERIE
jgi:hypothetical protein